MILEFADWLFLANVEENKTFSSEEVDGHCTCAFCRNFYQTVDRVYPDLRYFLARFGMNIEAPESFVPMTKDLYQASYVIQGKILRFGSEPIFVNGLPICVEDDPDPEVFVLNLGLMQLPWVLTDTPAPEGTGDGFDDLFAPFTKLMENDL